MSKKPDHIKQQNWDDVDIPELADDEFKRMRPASEDVPGIVDDFKRSRGRPRKENPKVSTTLRLDPEVLDYFREEGKGWQTRINEALREYVASQR